MARRAPAARGQAGTAKGRPVMLATLDVPFDANAVTFAVDSAVELGQRLIVANFRERAPLPLSAMLGCDDLPYPPQMEESLAAAATLARSLGVDVTRLRVKSFHPIRPCSRSWPSSVRGFSSSAPTGPGSAGCATDGRSGPSGPEPIRCCGRQRDQDVSRAGRAG